jgi:hypothetical protein
MKYEITNETRAIELKTVHRIRALKDFGDVKAGDYGGWVQTKNNLSQEGDCWIYDEAIAMDMARIKDNAKLMNESRASGHAKILDSAILTNSAEAFDRCHIYGNAKIQGFAKVYGEAEVYGDTVMKDQARAHKSAWVYGNDIVLSNTMNVTERATRTPISVNGLNYDVTITDNHIRFDCETRSINDWINITDEELLKINGRKAVIFNRRYRKIIMELLEEQKQSNI